MRAYIAARAYVKVAGGARAGRIPGARGIACGLSFHRAVVSQLRHEFVKAGQPRAARRGAARGLIGLIVDGRGSITI